MNTKHADGVRIVSEEEQARAFVLDWTAFCQSHEARYGLAPRPLDNGRLTELFSRLGFRTWLREVEHGGMVPVPEKSGVGAAAAAAAVSVAPDRSGYETILRTTQLEAWLRKIGQAQLTSPDTETTAPDPVQARLVGIPFCIAPGAAAYLPLGHSYAGAPDLLPLLRRSARRSRPQG